MLSDRDQNNLDPSILGLCTGSYTAHVDSQPWGFLLAKFRQKRELKFLKSKMKLFWRVLIPGSEKKKPSKNSQIYIYIYIFIFILNFISSE